MLPQWPLFSQSMFSGRSLGQQGRRVDGRQDRGRFPFKQCKGFGGLWRAKLLGRWKNQVVIQPSGFFCLNMLAILLSDMKLGCFLGCLVSKPSVFA